MYNYKLSMLLPLNASDSRAVSFSDGNLIEDYEPSGNKEPIRSCPQAIHIKEYQNVDPIVPTAAENLPDVKVIEKACKMVRWNKSYIIWLSPSVLINLRDITNRKIIVEFNRFPLPKHTPVPDGIKDIYRARAIIDLEMALNPNVVGIKGLFPLDSSINDAESDIATINEQKGKFNDIYRALCSTVGITLLFSSPLVDKIKLKAVYFFSSQ